MLVIVNFIYRDKMADEMKTDELLIESVLTYAHMMQIENLVD